VKFWIAVLVICDGLVDSGAMREESLWPSVIASYCFFFLRSTDWTTFIM